MLRLRTARPVNHLFAPLTAAVLALAPASGCDTVDIGRPVRDAGAPTLRRLLVVDLDRWIFSDVLATRPLRTCGPVDPCPSSGPPCVIEPGAAEGVCLDLLDPRLTPPPVAPPGFGELRLVLDQIVDPALFAGDSGAADAGTLALALPEGLLRLTGPDGAELPGETYYDPTGTPDPDEPYSHYGPALVLRPFASLAVATRYTVTVDATRLQNRDGAALAGDPFGALPESGWSFTTEPLYVVATEPAFGFPDAPPLAPDDALALTANAPIAEPAPAAPGAAAFPGVTVKDAQGAPVAVQAFRDRGEDPVACEGNPTVLRVLRVTAPGEPAPWAPGVYTLEAAGVLDLQSATIALALDAHGSPATLRFTVAADAETTTPANTVLLPERCDRPAPPDLGVDKTQDAGAPPSDSGITDDAGIPDMGGAD